MFRKPHCPVIAIEEHYWDDELVKTYSGPEAVRAAELSDRLRDFEGIRLKEMDEAGIDIQVLSHGAPSAQKLAADIAVAAHPRRQRPATRARHSPARPLRRLRRAADRNPGSGRRRIRAHGEARLQGRDAARPRRRRLPRRQALLADLRPRGEARSADLSASFAAASRRAARLLQRLHERLPDAGAAGLGLYGGDRDHRDPPRALGRVREAPEAQIHPRPSRRDAAVPPLAHHPHAGAAGADAGRASATSSPATSPSPRAATSPIRRCFAA